MQALRSSHLSWAGIALLSVFALGLTGCGNGSGSGSTGSGGETASGDKIKIGVVASLNGELKPWGVDSRDGSKLAVDEFNAAGGLNGKQVQLLVEDSNSKPETGKSATEKLISEGCIAIIGETASGISGAMKEATTEKKIPQVMVGATNPKLTEGTDDVFRVCYTDNLQGPVMAKFAYDDLHLRKVAVITDEKQPYSTFLSAAFTKAFTKFGGTVIDEEKYNSGDTQFSGLLTNVKAKNPDGVFASGYFTEVGPIVRQAREAGIGTNVPFLGGDGWDSKEILTSGGDAIIGCYFCNHYTNKDTSPIVQDFLKKWEAMPEHSGQLPGTTMGALGYDAAGLVLDALKRAKSPTAADLRDAIDNTELFHGVSGDIKLKGFHGDPPKRALVVKLTNDPQNPQELAKAFDFYDVFPELKPKEAAPSAPSKN